MPKLDPFAELILDEPAIGGGDDATVPNVKPRITSTPYKIAIIGEAPGLDEVEQGKPFVGWSGKELDRILSRFGIVRDACFVGNICQHRPPGNKIAAFDWNGPQIQGGIARLGEDLKITKPNICLLLGGSALHAFKAPTRTPTKRKIKGGETVFMYPNPIGLWRGSFFISPLGAPLESVKCIASYHPAACLRQYKWFATLMLDVKRCLEEATTKEWHPPLRQLKVGLSYLETLSELDKIILNKPTVATDIEGGIGTMSCISFATAADYAFIVPFTKGDGSSWWSADEEVEIWKRLTAILSDPTIPKVLQNSLYDMFVLQYGYQVPVRGVVDDTLVKHWEIYCEMRKSLAYLASIYTNEPYWKEERVQAEQGEEEE